jgi:hypothetical protein
VPPLLLGGDGVLLLDEFENAIHTSLLRPLAAFVVTLAKQFDVQVFLASHSKEAIDAFVGVGLGGDLAGYRMARKGKEITAQCFDGTRLAKLHGRRRLRHEDAVRLLLAVCEGDHDIAFVHRSAKSLGDFVPFERPLGE